jgi:hypothetical protein
MLHEQQGIHAIVDLADLALAARQDTQVASSNHIFIVYDKYLSFGIHFGGLAILDIASFDAMSMPPACMDLKPFPYQSMLLPHCLNAKGTCAVKRYRKYMVFVPVCTIDNVWFQAPVTD